MFWFYKGLFLVFKYSIRKCPKVPKNQPIKVKIKKTGIDYIRPKSAQFLTHNMTMKRPEF